MPTSIADIHPEAGRSVYRAIRTSRRRQSFRGDPGAEVRCGEPRLAALAHQCVFNDPAGQEVNPVLADILACSAQFAVPSSLFTSALEPDNLAGCTSAP